MNDLSERRLNMLNKKTLSLKTSILIVILAAFVFQLNVFSQDKASKIDELMKVFHDYG